MIGDEKSTKKTDGQASVYTLCSLRVLPVFKPAERHYSLTHALVLRGIRLTDRPLSAPCALPGLESHGYVLIVAVVLLQNKMLKLLCWRGGPQ